MGMRILERGDVIKGSPVVQPGDDLFWFNRPGLILFLIHVLFENTFQLAFFAWSWYEFGYPSYYHENLEDLIIRIFNGCPYTGPLQLCNSPSICLSQSGTTLQLALDLFIHYSFLLLTILQSALNLIPARFLRDREKKARKKAGIIKGLIVKNYKYEGSKICEVHKQRS
ncbi:mlo-like protein 12 [Phtheirospermum japonicum]|uniref:Mlo-like protein 12 n=1 Tax=Phtheirospermum japonicum TaxID=374723 RepID=A0A830BQK5_9LAMI|nr:mlo-like protein 12 [Phtheirospermum japonicum]